MSAFSHHNQDPASFFLDQTVFFPNPNTTSFPQFHHNSFNGHHHHHHDQANSAVTNKLHSPDSSMSMVLDEHKAENGNDQLAKKRKDKQMVSHHAQSKDTSNKIKKQKKIGDNDQEDKRKKKSKKDSCEEDEAVGYIHVRARRGQATDSHSLAERVRREKISERMKLLQAIVPGCDKVTGKALMLDEIINYVQSLQNQVEFLSMKLASVNPMLYDFGDGLDSFMLKPDENMSSMVLPIMPSVQQNLSNGGITFVPTNNNYNNYLPQLMDHGSAVTSSLLFQQYSQGNGDQLWDVDEQRLKLDNGFVLSDNSTSFQ